MKTHQVHSNWSSRRKSKSTPRNKPKRKLQSKSLVKKKKPPSLNPRLHNLPERPQRLPWMSKPQRFKNSQSRPSKHRMELQRKLLKSPKLHLKKVRKKSSQPRKLSLLNPQFKKPSLPRRKSKNKVNKAPNNNKSRLQRKSLPQSRLPPSQSPSRFKNHLNKKVKRKWSQPKKPSSPNPHFKRPLSPQFKRLFNKRKSQSNLLLNNLKKRLQRRLSKRLSSLNLPSNSQLPPRRNQYKKVNNHLANKLSQLLRLPRKS